MMSVLNALTAFGSLVVAAVGDLVTNGYLLAVLGFGLTYWYLSVSTRKVYFGTLNMIGESFNPIEFEPALSDEQKVEYDKFKEMLTKSEEDITFKCLLDKVPGFLQEKLREYMRQRSFYDFTSVKEAILSPSSPAEINLDNKVGAEKGRLNPIALFLAKTKYSGAYQFEAFQEDNINFLEQQSSFFGSLYDAGNHTEVDILELMIWDLYCTVLFLRNPEAVKGLYRLSPYYNPTTEMPLTEGDKLEQIFEPVISAVKRYREDCKNLPVVLGLQEMPDDDTKVYEALKVLKDTGVEFNVHRNNNSGTGFILSSSVDFEDVTDFFRNIVSDCLDENGITGKVKSTTLKKMVAVHCDADGDKFISINFHCKSFKKDTDIQAKVIGLCFKEGKRHFGCPVNVGGDMNLDAKWNKKMSPKDQEEVLNATPPGYMPKCIREYADRFFEGVKTFEVTIVNVPEMYTTLKRRTCWQAQPKKTDMIACTCKDILICSGCKILVKLIRGNKVGASNMDSLMPYPGWPGDHFFVSALVQFTVWETLKSKLRKFFD